MSALSRLSGLGRYVAVAPEVQDALHRSLPVIALETAITSHGLPLQQAISTASSLDSIIRKGGAVPAVVGLIDGKVKIGCSEQEIQRLASSDEPKWKVGRRDIAAALVKKINGGTTVSATSFLANLAGVDVFCTGGIGGVHRGAQETMDISSDLTELGRTPVAVVCAGAKSILDIGLTLEYLETLGVQVTTFGETTDFPAFYARKSGFHAPSNVRTAREAAELLHLAKSLGTGTGTLIGVPIPEQYEQKSIAIQKAVEQAVEESERNGIAKRGKEVTPWILAKVKELTGGESVESNIALIENNAKVATAIAVELSKLKQSPHESNTVHHPQTESRTTSLSSKPAAPAKPSAAPLYRNETDMGPYASLAVIGAAAVDIVSRPISPNLHTTAPGTVSFTLGGVARNVHEAAFRLGIRNAQLIAPVGTGSDPLKAVLRDGLASLGCRTDGLLEMDGRTPCVNMTLDENGDLAAGVAQTELVEDMTAEQVIERLRISQPSLVCFDGNLSESAIRGILKYCDEGGIKSVFEPTSNIKALRWLNALPASDWPVLSYMAPNVHELRSLQAHLTDLPLNESSAYSDIMLSWQTDEMFRQRTEKTLPSWVISEGVLQSALRLIPLVNCLFIKAGARGLLVVQRVNSKEFGDWQKLEGRVGTVVTAAGSDGGLVIIYHEAIKLEKTASVVGGGDSLLGGLLAGLSSGLKTDPAGLDKLVLIGQSAAVASLRSSNSIGNLEELSHLMH